MNSIVVYRILIVSWFIILASGLTAQKPAIDLISSHRQYRHPEAIIDTGYAVTPLFRDGFLTPTAPDQNHKSYPREETEKKKRRQIGPSFDSIFQKEEKRIPSREESPVDTSFSKRKLYPIVIIFFITALK